MKRHLVVTSSTNITVTHSTPEGVDGSVERASFGERKRLEAYLYAGAEITAIAHSVEKTGGSNGSHGEWVYTARVNQRALVTVEGDSPERARYLATYQTGRLQSGLFGVEDYVEDVLNARIAVLGDEAAIPSDKISIADALDEAANALDSEEVRGALGLDGDYDFSFTTITVDGVERPYTEADQADAIARHEKIIKLLRELAEQRR